MITETDQDSRDSNLTVKKQKEAKTLNTIMVKKGQFFEIVPMGSLLVVGEVAKRLSVSKRMVYRLAAEGKLIFRKAGGRIGIFEKSVDNYLRCQEELYLANGQAPECSQSPGEGPGSGVK